jgi:hypothetical protein
MPTIDIDPEPVSTPSAPDSVVLVDLSALQHENDPANRRDVVDGIADVAIRSASMPGAIEPI